jgi:hypothetical protein
VARRRKLTPHSVSPPFEVHGAQVGVKLSLNLGGATITVR